MTQNPMNICSDFHLGRHFLGLAMNAFVGILVTLQPNNLEKLAILYRFIHSFSCFRVSGCQNADVQRAAPCFCRVTRVTGG